MLRLRYAPSLPATSRPCREPRDDVRATRGAVDLHSSSWSSALGGGGGAGGPPSACVPTRAAHAAHARSSHEGVALATHARTLPPSFSASRSRTKLHPLEQSRSLQFAARRAQSLAHRSSGPRGTELGKGGAEGKIAAASGSQAARGTTKHKSATRITRHGLV